MNGMSTNTTPINEDLSQLTTYKVGVLEATVHRNLRKFCESVLASHSISKMHWMLIGTVRDHNGVGIRLTDLAKELGTTISYITVSVNLLSSRGILSRVESASDSRSVLISICDDYMPICDEIEQELRESLRQVVYPYVSPADLGTYLKVLLQLSVIDPAKIR